MTPAHDENEPWFTQGGAWEQVRMSGARRRKAGAGPGTRLCGPTEKRGLRTASGPLLADREAGGRSRAARPSARPSCPAPTRRLEETRPPRAAPLTRAELAEQPGSHQSSGGPKSKETGEIHFTTCLHSTQISRATNHHQPLVARGSRGASRGPRASRTPPRASPKKRLSLHALNVT